MPDYDYGGYDCNECCNAEREIARLERKLAAAGAPDPAAIAAAKAEGAREATAAIVAWLRADRHLGLVAKDIERGEHLKPGAGK